MLNTPTMHNSAKQGEIAPFVLMPGDPVRASYIAKHYLEHPRLVNQIRGMYAYTGTYQQKEVSVMASGMGTSSMSIYSYELFNFYHVNTIIRVGSAGGLQPFLNLMDLVIGISSSTDSSYPALFHLPGTIAPTADFSLAEKAMAYAREHNITAYGGPLFCGEAFYYDKSDTKKWADMGILAVEMESAALYLNAAKARKRALTLCTISDLVFTGSDCSNETRESGFDAMIQMALALCE
ncbi:MAG: purine-nucleoside phosphorylase [Lachnospiraceae bacterium]|jgi:purine-nucleoside phosphorylase|nr:purine-nucleoside phosphorylase [Lachnospiraceae bacterium]